MRSLFSVQFESEQRQHKDPLDVILGISLNYAVPNSICDVIHERNLIKYNSIFRFLLQIKWAIWSIETLQFPIAFKKRRPYQPLNMVDLLFRRLTLLRNWIIYAIQCVHSHLMSFVIQSMGQQFTNRAKNVECLRDIIELHDSYVETIYDNCFQKVTDSAIYSGIEQLLHFAGILRDEWNNIISIERNGDDIDGTENVFNLSDAVAQIDIIENTYISCHCYIAEKLSKEVYTKERTECKFISVYILIKI